MIYSLPLGLLLLVVPYCVQTQENTNIMEDDPSVSLQDNSMSISVDEDTITAGNTKCKQGTKCGYHNGASYSWCETDDGWEYCCIGACEVDELGDKMSCPVGSKNVRCGNPGSRTVKGTACLASHPCGTHGNAETIFNIFWCYIDEKKNWQSCCSPLDTCRDRGDDYGNWCYTGIIKVHRWDYCTP